MKEPIEEAKAACSFHLKEPIVPSTTTRRFSLSLPHSPFNATHSKAGKEKPRCGQLYACTQMSLYKYNKDEEESAFQRWLLLSSSPLFGGQTGRQTKADSVYAEIHWLSHFAIGTWEPFPGLAYRIDAYGAKDWKHELCIEAYSAIASRGQGAPLQPHTVVSSQKKRRGGGQGKWC